jgi:hypothetical protein
MPRNLGIAPALTARNKEYAMKANWNTLVAGAVVLGVVACGRIGKTDSQSYDKLVDKYNNLIDTSHKLTENSLAEESALGDLNRKLELYAAGIDNIQTTYFSQSTVADTKIADLRTDMSAVQKTQSEIYSKLNSLEMLVLKQATAIDRSGPTVYQTPETAKSMRELSRIGSGLDDSIAGKSRALNGIRKLVDSQMKSINSQWQRMQIVSQKVGMPSVAASPTIIPAPKIQLTKKDEEVTQNVRGGAAGFARSGGKVSALTSAQAVSDYAAANGFNPYAASDSYKISSRSGGLVTFAAGPTEIPQSISDMVAHIKPTLNSNNDDLELAFVIDYSGSMSDDIDSVIKGLVGIVKDFENVKVAGRNVKIALVLFGEPGRETVELNLTGDMVKVADNLTRILREFSTKGHSTEPGEASYHGLEITAKKVNWSSKNRMAVLITDEPSSELQGGDTTYVDGVINALSATGVDTHIYTIVVR